MPTWIALHSTPECCDARPTVFNADIGIVHWRRLGSGVRDSVEVVAVVGTTTVTRYAQRDEWDALLRASR